MNRPCATVSPADWVSLKEGCVVALKPGSAVGVGEFLRVNDYIQSPQGLFFAIQQSDGNFCGSYSPGYIGVSV